jgi:hypothetical protein
VFREQDATIAPGLRRAPIHRDSIAITEWGMDSHSVSMEMVPGSRREGKILLTELTRPGQVPWRCLLPADFDNLLVPVCLSATHVGWGTIRLEPTWMHLAESAGFAAALAVREGIAPAQLKVARLQRHLVERGVMISFFNEFDLAVSEPWVPAVQYLGAKWFFDSYDARPEDPLDAATARIWSSIAADLLTGKHRHLEETRWSEIYPTPGPPPSAVTSADLQRIILAELEQRALDPAAFERAWQITPLPASSSTWRRADACLLFYRLLQK